MTKFKVGNRVKYINPKNKKRIFFGIVQGINGKLIDVRLDDGSFYAFWDNELKVIYEPNEILKELL